MADPSHFLTKMFQCESPPFEQVSQLNRDSSINLAVRHGIQDTAAGWNGCLDRDLETRLTDDIYPYLWLVATQDATHIDPLHKHLIKKRAIVTAEDPKLHLVWFYETVYIKPLPDYLLNYTIWEKHISKSPAQPISNRPRYDKYRAALGFLRSYSFLIRHESDFIIAQKANLLPKYISFQRFQKFIQPFRSLNNYDVSHRYHYGQFRLTRLNLIIRLVRIANILYLFRPDSERRLPWNYQEQLWQTSQYLQHYAAPLIFVFAILSLILSSMQVVLAALGSATWEVFIRISWGFSIGTIIFAILPIISTLIGVSILLIAQGQFAMRMKWRAMRSKNGAKR
ncbi:hypothetical protein GGR51DRAFT_534946 [Nemania sp. FL0031]|nr:hypothetical protein GGR51DRAFT_534946 [Nemania sp. FL0031]